MEQKIYVYECFTNLTDQKMGTIYVDGSTGKEVFSFEYDSGWLGKNKTIIRQCRKTIWHSAEGV